MSDLAPESKELHHAFAPGGKQKGRGRTPVGQIVVGHDLVTGAATPAVGGPKYGKERTREQRLGRQLSPSLPAGSGSGGERNCGVLGVPQWVSSAGPPGGFRLSSGRAQRILGKAPRHGRDEKVVWPASGHERRAPPECANNTRLKGRGIGAHRQKRGERQPTKLSLLTTLALPAATISEL